jgi:hypothetical protein
VTRIAKLFTLALLICASTVALSTPVTGKWTGKLAVRFAPPVSKDTKLSPDFIQNMQKLLDGIRIALTIKADGTYVAVTKGASQKDGKTVGKWTLKGKTLTLTPNEKRPPEIGTVSKDGKTLTMSIPKDMTDHGVKGNAVFTKG